MNKLYIYLVLATVILSACSDPEQKIDWNTGSIPPKLIVEGGISNNLSSHPITLKKTSDYFKDQELTNVSRAVVSVSYNQTTLVYIEDENKPGRYYAQTPFAGERGTEYKLNIKLAESVDDETVYTSSAEIIEGMRIDSMRAELYDNPYKEFADDEDSLSLVLTVYGLEPANINNYYLLKLYKNGHAVSDTVTDATIITDNATQINGKDYAVFVFEEQFIDGDEVELKMHSISKHYYEFLRGVHQISQEPSPFGFSGPPANALGNINNGKALGYFCAKEESSAKTNVIYFPTQE